MKVRNSFRASNLIAGPKARPESSRGCLVCSEFARQWGAQTHVTAGQCAHYRPLEREEREERERERERERKRERERESERARERERENERGKVSEGERVGTEGDK